jgi:hypothetical protein
MDHSSASNLQTSFGISRQSMTSLNVYLPPTSSDGRRLDCLKRRWTLFKECTLFAELDRRQTETAFQSTRTAVMLTCKTRQCTILMVTFWLFSKKERLMSLLSLENCMFHLEKFASFKEGTAMLPQDQVLCCVERWQGEGIHLRNI